MHRALHMGIVLVIVVALAEVVGCERVRQSQTNDADSMKRAIAELKGTYTWRSDLGRYDYSDKTGLEAIYSDHQRKLAVAILVECLDDTSASASVLDGKPIALGIVCYEALTQLVYFEPTEPGGDVAATWPGIITPLASPKEMRDAKAAWKKAEEAKLLIFQ